MELNINDFEKHSTENTYQLKGKNLHVFGKILASDRIKLLIESEDALNNDLKSLSLFLIKISNFKDELINFYNNDFEFEDKELADESWYNQLEIYRLILIPGLNNKWYAEIVAGDKFFIDHLLDIELDENTVFSMNYDG